MDNTKWMDELLNDDTDLADDSGFWLPGGVCCDDAAYPGAPTTPGSKAAVARGCTCSVAANAHGYGAGILVDGEPLYWIAEGCPLHDPLPRQENAVARAVAEALIFAGFVLAAWLVVFWLLPMWS
jgi:hypothetical protein